MGLRALQSSNDARTPIAASPFSSAWVERGLILSWLATAAIRFYPTAGRFLDQDEIYFFYLSDALRHGARLYSGLKTYYPPLLFYIGAGFLALFDHNLYLGLLGARIFAITLILFGMLSLHPSQKAVPIEAPF